MSRPLVVHISGDFPDAVQPRKTRAIAALVEGTTDAFEHRVYSLNRVGRTALPGAIEKVADDGHVASWTYAAPPGGLFLATAMRRVADAILDDIARRGIRVTLVQGHKLTIEGLAARRVAEALGVPYALSLQGNTDQKILGVRRDLRGRYARIFRGAARVFPFSPWIADWTSARLGASAHPPVLLPCVPVRDAVMAPVVVAPKVISAFHLDHYKLKNVEALAVASAQAARAVPDLTLELAGDGAPAARAAVDARLAGGPGRRIGHVDSAAIQPWMNGAAVFALPSLRETFGMVFVEALLSGCPIVYPAGRAVDGYFADADFAIAVPPRDAGALADAIVTLVRDQERRKAALARWQADGGAARFRRDAILATYRDGLRAALGEA
jgi:glycosyltransferase involved in cell wall biosynthesis